MAEYHYSAMGRKDGELLFHSGTFTASEPITSGESYNCFVIEAIKINGWDDGTVAILSMTRLDTPKRWWQR